MKGNSATLFRGIAALLAGLGLLPFFWAGFVSRDLSVARVTLIDPIVVAGICLAIGIFAPRRTRALLSRAAAALRSVPAPIFVGIVAIVIVVAGVVIAHLAYNGQPALTDELSEAFQGRILVSGRLAALPEAYREFFETGQTVNRYGHWFSQYPIGSGALAPLGILVNPLLLALAAVAIHVFARRAYDETTARIATLLVALSPFALFMAGTRINHVPTLTLTAIAFAALRHWTDSVRGKGFPSAAIIGSALGAVVLFRPYDAVLIALPIAVFQLAHVFRRRDLMASLVVEILAAAAITSIQLWVNARTTGTPFLFGYDALNGAAHRPGFHVDPLGFPFTPSMGFDHIMIYLQRLNTSLFESAVPAAVFIVVAMWLARPTRWDWLLAGLILSFLAGYGAYWYEGQLNGPRFLYPAIVAFVVFTARFVVLCARRERPLATGAALMVPLCVGLAFLPSSVGARSTGVWLRLSAMRALPVSRSEDPAAETRAAGLHNALVFVREPFHARLAARLRALGMAPFDAERTVSDLDACALLSALDGADAHPEIASADRLRSVFTSARTAGQARPISGQFGSSALALIGGRPSSDACQREIAGDSLGTVYYARFLAAATIDSTGRLGGDVVYARWLGARDSMLLHDRFASRVWYMYRRDEKVSSGRFERIR